MMTDAELDRAEEFACADDVDGDEASALLCTLIAEVRRLRAVNLSPEETWIVVIATIRYSMGRMTAMTSFAPELYWKFEKLFTPSQRQQIAEEVEREVRLKEASKALLGSEIDHQVWKQFAATIRLREASGSAAL